MNLRGGPILDRDQFRGGCHDHVIPRRLGVVRQNAEVEIAGNPPAVDAEFEPDFGLSLFAQHGYVIFHRTGVRKANNDDCVIRQHATQLELDRERFPFR